MASAERPRFAIFDLQSSEQVTVGVRWLLVGAGLFLIDVRPTLPPPTLLAMNLVIGLAMAANVYWHVRLLRGHRFGYFSVLVASLADAAAISAVLVLTGRFGSTWFVFYYPAILAFSLVFAPPVTFAYAGTVAAAYSALSVALPPGVNWEAQEEKQLLARLLVMFAVAALGNYVVRDERERRRQAVEAEEERGRENLELHQGLLFSLALAVEAKDNYTAGHLERVAHYAEEMGGALGLSDHDLAVLRAGALLHDVGKMAVPDEVLNKPGPLDSAEWEQMRQHPVTGARILSAVPGAQMERIVAVVGHHHERWDGRGYPHGRQEEAIPLLARIVSVADVFDALATARPYRAALPHDEVVRILRESAGTYLDPALVRLFLEQRLHERAEGTAGWGPGAMRSPEPAPLTPSP